MIHHPTKAELLSRQIIERDNASLSPSYKREYDLVVDQAFGSELWDVDGRRYIDFMAGVAVTNVGHRHPTVHEAIQDQLDKFWHICLSDFYYPQAVQLAEKIQAIAPMSDTRVYFGNSGAEAVEAAIKLAMYHTGRTKFIGFIGAFHGRTLGALSFTASKNVQRARYTAGLKVHHIPYPDPYRPLLTVPYGDNIGDSVIDYLENQVFRTLLAPRDVAGILVEPIQGEGGYVIPAPGFFKRLREVCDKHGILLIVDEIQSGAGRTGRWWAIEHEGIEPDIICFAKGIGSGFPIGGIVARRNIMSWGPGSHGSTFGGNPIAAIAAIATLDVIESEGLMNEAQRKGKFLLDRLIQLQIQHPNIGDVRGRGLMIGIEFVTDKITKEHAVDLRNEIVHKSFDNGLLLLPCGPSALRFTPALNIPDHLLEEGLAIFENTLDQLSRIK